MTTLKQFIRNSKGCTAKSSWVVWYHELIMYKGNQIYLFYIMFLRGNSSQDDETTAQSEKRSTTIILRTDVEIDWNYTQLGNHIRPSICDYQTSRWICPKIVFIGTEVHTFSFLDMNCKNVCACRWFSYILSTFNHFVGFKLIFISQSNRLIYTGIQFSPWFWICTLTTFIGENFAI